MHDAERRAVEVGQLVRVVQPRQRLGQDEQVQRQRQGLPPHAGEDAVERLALEVLHRQVRPLPRLADLVGLHHVRVVQPRRQTHLVEKHLVELAVARELRLQLFDDEELAEVCRALRDGQVHMRHAPLTEARDEPVATNACALGVRLRAHGAT
ncbi:MAG TPA: hypothetical protein VFS43_13160 [Polyangiaceae bacterium]|nr:hypothetical protein [Polyangiaceae bacterium]